MPSFISIGDTILFEPILFFIVLVSGLACLVFANSLFNSKVENRDKERQFLKSFLFLSLSLSLIFGAVTHGFFPNFISGRLMLWKASLVLFGLATFFNFVIAGQSITNKNKKLVYILATLEFLIYQFYVTVIDTDFKIALVNYFISVVFFYLVSFKMDKIKNKILGFLAFLLLFASFFVYTFKINIENTAFNHVILYHLLFFASNYALFKFYHSPRIKRKT
ncbi:MAG: DUF6962 family protein [Candidatus Pacearchaeota archaeon]